ncbi:MAG: tRNA (adenosine(37)-N6)-dimethylallyltransferase MiaA [Planctomycetes bacterium]|nr:tRNA (adenosine(37)-N6)-dimethylallyltransferase MiaA [Planctomycetota bacterium]
MDSRSPLKNCWYLVGPTAAGKTAIGIALAQRIGGEILSLDSMAVYRGMDIGTAKPDATERAQTPHHLLDLVEPNANFSIADYLTAAHRVAAEVRGRGREVLFVGGTPLYLKALLCGLAEGPEPDWESRQRLLAEAQAVGAEELHRRLAEVDPVAAAKLHPNDTRRIVRALEVFHTTGQPISAQQQHFRVEPPAETCSRVFVLDWPRPLLHSRINARVDAMFDAGFVDEVRRLLSSHDNLGRTASQAAGYREVAEHLAGALDLPTAIERTKARTRQLARRQLTWLRGLKGCRWIAMAEPLDSEEVAARIVAAT